MASESEWMKLFCRIYTLYLCKKSSLGSEIKITLLKLISSCESKLLWTCVVHTVHANEEFLSTNSNKRVRKLIASYLTKTIHAFACMKKIQTSHLELGDVLSQIHQIGDTIDEAV